MSLPIRAFLIIRRATDDWSVSVCRDFEMAQSAWFGRDNSDHGAVLHLGFDRPRSHAFEQVVSEFPGRLLLTASAKYGLPQGYEASEEPIGYVDKLPIYVGTRGWGYEIEDTFARAGAGFVQQAIAKPSGWVASFLAVKPDLVNELLANGIFDDETYMTHERSLSWEARYRTGLFRYRTLVADQESDPSAIARAAPPWLAERICETLDLTVRITNVFEREGITKVSDLQNYGYEYLLGLRNFGRRSIRDLCNSLLTALEQGPFTVTMDEERAVGESLVAELERTLGSLDRRECDILTRRMGFGRPAETLMSIASDYDLTRERIRQIEDRAVRKMAKAAYWDDLLTAKLEAFLNARSIPLPVLGVEALDTWFDGAWRLQDALKYILANFCGDRIAILRIDDVDYFSLISQKEWDEALIEAARILESGAGQGWTLAHCSSLVTALLPARAAEFRSMLWDRAVKKCHFAKSRSGEQVLVSYGRGAEQIVEAILAGSDYPLHYSEIADRCIAKGYSVDIGRYHDAAGAVGILLGRGIFGLEKHIPLSDEEADIIREEAENIVLGGSSGRQWHASEIIAALAEADSAKGVDKYILDYVLRKSTVLSRLGRMTWVEANSGLVSTSDRIEVKQALISILQDAGTPLTTMDLKSRLSILRGTSDCLQIVASDPLIRLGRSWWGLNDRDVPIKRDQQPKLIEDVVALLRRLGRGIHISEVSTLEADTRATGVPPSTIFDLATLDGRARVTYGNYLYLSEWGEPRRETVLEAVRAVISTAERPLSLDEVMKAAADRVGREVDRAHTFSYLQTIEAEYDAERKVWMSPKSDDEDDEPIAA